MEKLWYQISRIGLVNGEKDRRDLILLNKMAFILMALTLFITLVEIFNLIFFDNPMRYGSQRVILVWIISFACLLLNKKRLFFISKLILSLVPVFLLTLYPLLFNDARNEYIFYNAIIVLAFSIIPHVLFTPAKEKPFYYGSLIYLLVLVIVSDILYLKTGKASINIYQEVVDNLFYLKLAHVVTFVFINSGIIYFKRITQKSEADLEAKNIELKDHKEELLAQNEELISYQEELQAKHEALTESMQRLEDAQSQLIMSEKMASLGQLMAGIAHEINNPVNYIQAGVTGLKEILKDFEELIDVINQNSHDFPGETCKKITAITESLDLASAKEDMHTIADSILEGIHRTTEIIGGLKQFSYHNEEKLMMYNIHESIDTSLILLHNKYKDRIEIEKNYGKIPMMECFPGYLNQAMLNILDNAIDAIPGKGVISICTKKKDKGIIIEINDNGPGIPKEIQSKIFDPFFTTKEIGQGTGLGLSITYDIIKKHDGKIWVKSEIGTGTSFFIFLHPPQGDS
jgi:signal transduction histidine kinase